MQTTENRNDFFIWGVDQSVYGPVELPTVVEWIKDERVLADTWIHIGRDSAWRKAADVTELQMFFRKKAARLDTDAAFKPGVLRRVKILACLDDNQLDSFARFMELERVQQWSVVVQQGDHDDAMYLILEGELRVRLMAGERETILATLGPGDFFGDMSLFDHGPRSADVVANVDSTILKITASGFEKLAKEAPDLATPFLLSTIRTLVARIRADNKRLRDSVNISSAAGH
jgi:CRP-like cAMP-binding protein